jgi:hypothetical protein
MRVRCYSKIIRLKKKKKLYSFLDLNLRMRASLRGWPAEHFPGTPRYKRQQDVTGIFGNMVLVKSGFLPAKRFLQKLSTVWVHAFKNVRQSCSRLNNIKEYYFE